MPEDEPAPEPTPEPTPDPRVLTPEEADDYAARLGGAGYAFEAFEYGVRVSGSATDYDYRYDASAQTAVELMDRICAERGV